MKYLIIIDKK